MKSALILQSVSICLLLALWSFFSAFNAADILPSPLVVLQRIGVEAQSGDLFYHSFATLMRVFCAFVLALVLGSSLGIFMGMHKTSDRFFDPWLVLFLNIPALVIIVLCYIWIGLGEVAAIIAVAINKLPNVAVTMREGARALDQNLMEMAKLYRLTSYKKIRYVVLPQLSPYFMASSRSGLALVWKIVLVVELLGRSNGVGFQLHLFFQLFDVAGIMAYSLVFILIIALIEHLIMRPMDHHLNKWRADDAH